MKPSPMAPMVALILLAGCIDTGPVSPGRDGGPADGGAESDGLEFLAITFIDVGQGDAALFEMPDGSTILIDGGPDGAGQDAIVPLLWERGISTLELMVLTHPHADHCGGLDEVLEQVLVGEIWENGETLGTVAYQDFVAARDAEGALVRIAEAGDQRSFGGAMLTVLAADRGMPGENNDSIVIAFDFAGVRVLTTGDIERESQSLLVDEYGPDLASAVVKVPHHGSGNFDPLFVDTVAADFGVVSCGAGNPHGHPHPAAMAAWQEAGTALCRTDLSGDVGVVIDARGEVFFDCADP